MRRLLKNLILRLQGIRCGLWLRAAGFSLIGAATSTPAFGILLQDPTETGRVGTTLIAPVQHAPQVTLSDDSAYSLTVQQADVIAQSAAGASTQMSAESTPNTDEEKKAADEKAAAKKKQEELAKKVAGAHKPVFFDNDFSYLCDPAYQGWQLGDRLKKRCLPGGGWYDIGGEYRMRYHAERNMRGLGLTGNDDDFLLHRTRVYGDFHLNSDLRVFAEFIDAESNYENFTPRPIEVDRADMLNLFVDARLLADSDRTLTARVGRQELLFGAQRVISPLDWANTRRTFEGIRVMRKSKDLSIDGFWTHPVRVDPQNFDSPDRDQEFMGLYSSYTGRKDVTSDVYALRYLNGRGTNNFEVNTIGARQQGSQGDMLWDCEGAYQFGQNTDGSSHVSGAATFGLGRKLTGRMWDPVLWLYYDWASGDGATGQGNGYNHLFPLAHKYNGFMDLFGRRNLEDVNVLMNLSPSKKLKLLAWYHYFFLETQSDTPYSVVMTPFNGGNLPGSSDLGHEIDLLATYSVSARQQLVLGYSHFFSGNYYRTTAGVPFSGDADFFYSQWSIAY